MATIKNPWLGYLDRNYLQIKSKILDRLGATIPEMTDHSDSNILVIIIEAFGGVGEMLSYYIDNMAREAFLPTARKYSSMVKHTRLIDYRIKAAIAASVDVIVYFYNGDDTPYETMVAFDIPPGTKFTTANNIEFINVENINVPVGAKSINIPLVQKTAVVNESLGYTTNEEDQVFGLGKDYVNDSVQVKINGIPWDRKDTLGRSTPDALDYIVEVSAAKEAYIKFGDNINGKIPTSGQMVSASYYTTLGVLGNVESNTIINSTFNFTAEGMSKFTLSNPNKAVAGSGFEDVERIRRSAPLSIRTLYRAVTKQDYIDIALLAPGVDKAKLKFNCGKFIYMYIAPNGGGLASTLLLTSTEEYFENKKMITTFVKALPAGESQLYIDVEVTAKFRRDPVKLYNDLIALLLDTYSYDNSDINKAIRISDLISLLDNYPDTDYLSLKRLYTKPYVRPILTAPGINYNIVINTGSIATYNWKIKYDGTYMKLLKNNIQVKDLAINETWTDEDNILTITILPGAYIIGNEWEFKTLSTGGDQIIDDYSIPVLSLENINLVIKEQII